MAVQGRISIEDAWKLLFEEYSIPRQVERDGRFLISSAQINQVKEARLMAKFDLSSQLPKVFRKNRLAILPVSRGKYVIGPWKAYHEIAYGEICPKKVEIPELETLDSENLYSEAAALLFAYNSGIIQDVLGSSQVKMTVNGRMASGCFDYRVDTAYGGQKQLSVANAQVEIDGGYESPEAFCICEAKNSAAEEILIRQLYYPYRLWKSRLKKDVLPVFMAFTNDIFHFFVGEFQEEENYNSLMIRKHLAYSFADESISWGDIVEMWENTALRAEPDVTFPQANKFMRVVDLLTLLKERDMTREDVTENYEFDPRQTDYYITACEYLGLVKRARTEDGERIYRLTTRAGEIVAQGYRGKYMALIARILERPVFHEAFRVYLTSGRLPTHQNITGLMHRYHVKLGEGTMKRRSSTVRNWLRWILEIGNQKFIQDGELF